MDLLRPSPPYVDVMLDQLDRSALGRPGGRMFLSVAHNSQPMLLYVIVYPLVSETSEISHFLLTISVIDLEKHELANLLQG